MHLGMFPLKITEVMFVFKNSNGAGWKGGPAFPLPPPPPPPPHHTQKQHFKAVQLDVYLAAE